MHLHFETRNARAYNAPSSDSQKNTCTFISDIVAEKTGAHRLLRKIPYVMFYDVFSFVAQFIQKQPLPDIGIIIPGWFVLR